METKWTPGPWRADWDDNGQWYVEPLGLTGPKLRGDSGECIESYNAHLIAAAPELYEALEECMRTLEGDCLNERASGNAWNVARAALAKARGEA